MINNMISIPIHEKTEVVIDQIVNYKFFCPECGIVLHISKQFNYNQSFHNEKDFLSILSTLKNVFINPTQLDTKYTDIVHTHIANFEYISKIVDFEYFSMGASNDLFVRKMPPIKDCDANFGTGIFENQKDWFWYKHASNDQYLKNIVEYLGGTISDVRLSQIEGSFYKKDLFQEIVNVLKKIYNYEEVVKGQRIIYPREELYYSTVANLLNKNLKNQKSNYTFVPWKNPNFLPTLQEITDIAQGNRKGKYSVKRVLRSINDPVRFHISTFIGNYRSTSMNLIKAKMGKFYLNLFNLIPGNVELIFFLMPSYSVKCQKNILILVNTKNILFPVYITNFANTIKKF